MKTWDKVVHNTFVLLDKYREFITTVKFLWAAKFILSGVSIAAGYFFMYSLLIKFIPYPNLVIVFSLLILFALEAINFYLPMKYFKFILNPREELEKHQYFSVKKIKRFLFFSALFGFSLSFYTSSQGARMFAHRGEDHSKEITQWYETSKQAIEQKYKDLERSFLDEKQQIEQTPTVYKKGGREPELLSAEQLRRIADINEQIIGIEGKKTKELKELKQEYQDKLKQNEADKQENGWIYFAFAGALIITLNVINYFIVFFSKIIKLTMVEDEEYEKLLKYRKRIKGLMFALAEDDFERTTTKFSSVVYNKKEGVEKPNNYLSPEEEYNRKVKHANEMINILNEQTAELEEKLKNLEKEKLSTEDILKYSVNSAVEKDKKKEVANEPEEKPFSYDDLINYYTKVRPDKSALEKLQKYPIATKLMIERERSRIENKPQITIKEVLQKAKEQGEIVSRGTLYHLYTLINIFNLKEKEFDENLNNN